VRASIYIVLAVIFLSATGLMADESKQTLVLQNSDELRVLRTDSGTVWYGYGNVRLKLDSTYVTSDTVIWLREKDVIKFFGQVKAHDSLQNLEAKRISYYHRDSLMIAEDDVVMVNRADSVRTESRFARYDRKEGIVYLEGDPRLYLNYPDQNNLVTVTADYLTFYLKSNQGIARQRVVIAHKDVKATCDSADFYLKERKLYLHGQPYAVQKQSNLKGKEMRISFSGRQIDRINVTDSAQAFFVETPDSIKESLAGSSQLSGKTIDFYFDQNDVRKISATGSARSEYYPAPNDTTGSGENFVSGDSIFVYVKNHQITKAEISGGAEGVYITRSKKTDSTTVSQKNDSLAMTSTAIDTLPPIEQKISDTSRSKTDSGLIADSSLLSTTSFNDSVHYQGRFLEFFNDSRIIRMTGNAVVRREAVILFADKIDYDITKRVLLAVAAVDSSGDSTKIKPLSLKDSNEEIFGSKLAFNIDTKKGLIENANTKYEQMYYGGTDIYKDKERIFYIENGNLTSCDLAEPHFHFSSKKIKVIHNDRVIARPVTLYIETLPVMTIPYYVFPLKRGRHSGILQFKFGNFERGNMFFENVGYYWAASDYWDVTTSFDYRENVGVGVNGSLTYVKRYVYQGGFSGSYEWAEQELVDRTNRSYAWSIKGSHKQTLPYDIGFVAYANFVSDKTYNTYYTTDPYERLNRIMTSRANFNKRFNIGSLALNFEHSDQIDENKRTSKIPSGSFSLTQFNPFGSGKEVDGKLIQRWYNNFYLGYNNSFSITRSQSKLSDSKSYKNFSYLNHNVSLSSRQKLFGYFNVGPTLSAQETWYYVNRSAKTDSLGIIGNRAYRRGAVSAGVSADTKLYGTFSVNQFGLLAIRHVLSPSLSFSWAPDITKNGLVRNYVGVGGGGARRKSMTFGLGQLFQAKIRDGEQEKKLDLLNISSSASYNFEAKGQKLSTLETSFSSSLLKNISLSGSMSHDLYDYTGKLRWWSPRMRSFSISSSFQARGSVADNFTRRNAGETSFQDSLNLYQNQGMVMDSAISGPGGTSWNLNVRYGFGESGLLTGTTVKEHWVEFDIMMNLTPNLQVDYHQRYDFVRHQTISKTIDLHRKLHCWEGHFSWQPEGSIQQFEFRIYVTAIPDIKFEKSKRGIRGALSSW